MTTETKGQYDTTNAAATDAAPTKSMMEVVGEYMAMGYDPLSKKNSTGMDYISTMYHDTYDFINPEQFDLKGHAVFITGASRGLGRAFAISYAKAGASYIGIGARSPLDKVEKEIQEAAKSAGRAPPMIISLELDVTSKESVAEAAKRIEKEIGRCDILINNAGYMEPQVNITEADPYEWWRTYEVHIFGMFLMSRAFIPILLQNKDGLKTLINITSIAGLTKIASQSAYGITRFMTMRFSEYCNAGYGDQGLLTYHVHPGAVDTDLARTLPPESAQFLVDTPELGADTLVWLSAERREWLAGRYVNAAWDMEEFLAKKERIVKEDHLKMRMSVGLD